MTSLFARYRRVLLGVAPLAAVWLGTLVGIAALLVGARLVGALVLALVLVGIWWHSRNGLPDPHAAARAITTATLLAVGGGDGSGGVWYALGALALLGGILVDPVYRRTVKVTLIVRHLPGFTMPRRAIAPGPFFEVGCGLGVLAAAVVAGILPPVAFGVTSTVLVGIAALIAAWDLLQWRRGALPKAVRAALIAYKPRFYIYFSGKAAGLYQIAMWLPYLERTGERYGIVVRDQPFLEPASRLTESPVIYVRALEALEKVMVDSIGAVFYVNNETKNVNGVRFSGMRHVHLGHGDSDKPASYNATTAMFDRIFVAGQAGVDRYAAHGITIPREKFVIVGRPQVELLTVRQKGDHRPARATVLYAPTWRGGLADMGFGSLAIGPRIVAALLEHGCRVVFRPHPYSSRDAESRVLIGRIDAMLAEDPRGDHLGSAAASALTIFECMNLSDAMVSDVSSVASDYLYTGKPFAITDMHVESGPLAEAYPVVRAAYVLDRDADPEPTLVEMLTGDPLAAVRDRMRTYYLGDFPTQGYADVFVNAVRDAIEGRPAS